MMHIYEYINAIIYNDGTAQNDAKLNPKQHEKLTYGTF